MGGRTDRQTGTNVKEISTDGNAASDTRAQKKYRQRMIAGSPHRQCDADLRSQTWKYAAQFDRNSVTCTDSLGL